MEAQSSPTIYLSGPMSTFGPPLWGKPAFDKYAERYRAQGFKVISPPEHDLEILGGRPFTPGDYGQCLAADVRLLAKGGVDRIYMLPGWQESKGARLERFACQTVGIPVYDAETGQPMTTHLVVVEAPDPDTIPDAVVCLVCGQEDC